MAGWFKFQGSSSSRRLTGWSAMRARDVGEPSLRVDIVEARGLYEGVEDGGALPAAIHSAVAALRSGRDCS
jgi:hypothetical protein